MREERYTKEDVAQVKVKTAIRKLSELIPL